MRKCYRSVWMCIIFVVYGVAVSNAQEVDIIAARKELGTLHIPYTRNAYLSCAEEGDFYAISLFADIGMDLEIKGQHGMTALLLAINNGHSKTVDILLSKGANANAISNDRITPILVATHRNDHNLVETLLKHGADANTPDRTDEPVLLIAIKNDFSDIVNMLLENGANVNAKDIDGETGLTIATNKNYSHLVTALLAKDINARHSNGDTILIRSIQQRQFDQVANVLSKGADVNATNDNGETALFYAVSFGNLEIVNALLKRGTHVNIVYQQGRTPLLMASQHGYSEIVTALLQKGADITAQNDNGETALFYAVSLGNREMVNTLLEYGADVNIAYQQGLTPLLMAVQQGHVEITTALLRKGANVDTTNAKGDTALLIAAEKNDTDMIKLLVTHESSVNAQNATRWTALMFASKHGSTDVIKTLIAKGAEVNVQNETGKTALSYAIENNSVEIVKALIDHGADVTIKDNIGQTALKFAAEKGYTEIVRLLQTKDTEIDSQDDDGITALMRSSAEGHVDMVKLLLEKGANVNLSNKKGQTALMLASGKGHLSIVLSLLEKGAQVNQQDIEGSTALIKAAHMGHSDIISVLLEHGAEIDMQDTNGRTALMKASMFGRIEAVALLVERKASISMQDQESKTALIYALSQSITNKDNRIGQILLDNGAEYLVKQYDPVTDMEFVWIHGGCYKMGCISNSSDCEKNEKPVHNVCVDGFWMGIYEVTQAQWKQITRENPSSFNSKKLEVNTDNYPVEDVEYGDIQSYIQRLSEKAGKNIYRLPTEAEWEYAARAGAETDYYWGDDSQKIGEYAWCPDNSGKKTHPVGQLKPNVWGLYDMLGNVWEWCLDGYDDKFYSNSPIKNPLLEGYNKVIRGGSYSNWLEQGNICRLSNREINGPIYSDSNLGFRLVSQFIAYTPKVDEEPSKAVEQETPLPSVTPQEQKEAIRQVWGIIATQKDPLSIRKGEGKEYDIIVKAEKGSKVLILEEVGEWYKVQLQDGTIGYASNTYIQKQPASAQESILITDTEIQQFIKDYISIVNQGNVSTILSMYGDAVEYYQKGTVDNVFIKQDKQSYYKRWSEVLYELQEDISIQQVPGENTKIATFLFDFRVYNPQKNEGISGQAKHTLRIEKVDGVLKIVGENSKTLSTEKFKK